MKIYCHCVLNINQKGSILAKWRCKCETELRVSDNVTKGVVWIKVVTKVSLKMNENVTESVTESVTNNVTEVWLETLNRRCDWKCDRFYDIKWLTKLTILSVTKDVTWNMTLCLLISKQRDMPSSFLRSAYRPKATMYLVLGIDHCSSSSVVAAFSLSSGLLPLLPLSFSRLEKRLLLEL